jgi:putative ABC transport system ATP-binding protein
VFVNIIEARGIKKNYALGKTTVHALRGVDLNITKGNLLSIIGPSGSGKTTLLNIIGCIDQATDGSVTIGDRDVTHLTDKQITDIRLHRIGFIFQTFNLIPVLTAIENVEFPMLLMKKHSRSEIRRKAEALIDQVGLREYVRHRPAELSGGQRQRVAIARALVNQPRLLLADEPTGNLDSKNGEAVLTILQDINRRGTTVVLITHDPAVAKRAQRIIQVQDGELK